MTRHLKDVIRTFEPERRIEAEVADDTVTAIEFADGASALYVADFVDAIDALASLLDEETAEIKAARTAPMEKLTPRKLAMIDVLDQLNARAAKEPITLTPDLRAMVLTRIENLDRAIVANTAGLVAMRNAVLTINRALLKAIEKAASDGLYAPNGLAVRPVELSMARLDAAL